MQADSTVSEVTASFFDGQSPQRQDVKVALHPTSLDIHTADGRFLCLWLLSDVRIEDTPRVLRLVRHDAEGDTGARLEISDAVFRKQLLDHNAVLRDGIQRRKMAGLRIAGWGIAATISLGLVLYYGLPALASRMVGLVPWSYEQRLGQSIAEDVTEYLASGSKTLCGTTDDSKGRKALDEMIARLTAGADLPGPLTVRVVNSGTVNAFAAPGGHILILKGLLEKSESAEEVAGVLAHEIGHIHNRDAMRGVIHAAGLGLIFDILLGDVTGSGALYLMSQALIANSFSREQETLADAYGVGLMIHAQADPKAIGRFLTRVAKTPNSKILKLLSSHPLTQDRVTQIDILSKSARAAKPILDAGQWRSLQTICED